MHAYLHRVEGDLGNAGYWYRQAGQPVAIDALEAEWERIVVALLSGEADMTAASGKLIKGATGDWEVVIGMEVHAQVTSNAKLFSGASTAFGGEPNTHVSLVDAAMPGMLPVINEECVRQAVRTGLGLNAQDQSALGVRPQELFLSGLCRRATRSASTSRRSWARARSWSSSTAARPPPSASSGCIWSRTPASRCTTSRRRCPMSTSTAPAWR